MDRYRPSLNSETTFATTGSPLVNLPITSTKVGGDRHENTTTKKGDMKESQRFSS